MGTQALAWTTENEVWLLGNYMPCSVLQREEIRCIIQHGTMPPVFQTGSVLTARPWCGRSEGWSSLWM